MSYDLFLKPKSGTLSESEFIAYFSNRKNYNLTGNQAWYQNEDTGVYFLFEFQIASVDSEREFYYPIHFNMNYFRPSYFVDEAELEVGSFVTHFSMSVTDPQTDGMGMGDFISEKFISGWLHGNEFGYRAILKNHLAVTTLPKQKLHDAWEWNLNREALQETTDNDVFVPRIMFLSHNGVPVTACVWPDAIPSIIPEVDILLIGRKDLAPRKFFIKHQDMAIGSWAEIQPLLDRYKSKLQGKAYYLLYDVVPDEIVKSIKKMPSAKEGQLVGLNRDEILDSEIVEKILPDIIAN